MSVQDAIWFIEKVGQEDELKAKIRSGFPDLDLEDLVKTGAMVGLRFTAQDLRIAFVKDWVARWAHYRIRSVV